MLPKDHAVVSGEFTPWTRWWYGTVPDGIENLAIRVPMFSVEGSGHAGSCTAAAD